MRPPRFRLRTLLVAVAVVGMAVAALSRPTRGWGIAASTLFLTLLLTAILGSLLRRGTPRAFWIGFALFGWAYVAPLLSWLAFESLIIAPREGLIDVLVALGARDGKYLADLAGSWAQVDNESRLVVGTSTLGLLFAGFGGLIACRLYASERAPCPRRTVPPDPPPPPEPK